MTADQSSLPSRTPEETLGGLVHVTCPFDQERIPITVTFPMTPQGPVLHFDAPDLVEHMKQHHDDPIPEEAVS